MSKLCDKDFREAMKDLRLEKMQRKSDDGFVVSFNNIINGEVNEFFLHFNGLYDIPSNFQMTEDVLKELNELLKYERLENFQHTSDGYVLYTAKNTLNGMERQYLVDPTSNRTTLLYFRLNDGTQNGEKMSPVLD